MKHSKKIIAGILFSSLFLSACALTVSGTDTASQTVTAALTVPDAHSVREILEESANAMLKVQSYNYVSTNVSKFGTSEVTSTTKATVHPILGDGWIETAQGGTVNTTYLKNNTMYMVDPGTQSWVFVDMPKSAGNNKITINAKVNEYMTLEKIDSGYRLQSIRPLSALEFYMLSGIEGKEMQNLADMVNQGIVLNTVVELELDPEFRYRKVIYDQVTTAGGVSTQSYQEYTYSNYDKADPVVVPPAIMANALKFDPDSVPGTSTQAEPVPSSTTPAATTVEPAPAASTTGETAPNQSTPAETTPSSGTAPEQTSAPGVTQP